MYRESKVSSLTSIYPSKATDKNMLPSHIACVYLHGFLSSPQSKKAQELIQFFTDHGLQKQLRVPALSFEPAVAIQQARDAIQELQKQEAH